MAIEFWRRTVPARTAPVQAPASLFNSWKILNPIESNFRLAGGLYGNISGLLPGSLPNFRVAIIFENPFFGHLQIVALSQQRYQLLNLRDTLQTQKESLNRLLARDLGTDFSVGKDVELF